MKRPSDVVPFQNRTGKPADKSWRIAQVEAYWEGLRGGRVVPERSEILAAGISDALSHVFILEAITPKVARVRVAGQFLNTLMGMEVRGMPLSVLFAPAAREELANALESMFSTPAVIKMDLFSAGGFGRLPFEAKLLILPLRGEDGEITKAIGVIDADAKIGRAPRRFTVKSIDRRSLTGYGTLPEADEVREVAEPQAPYTPEKPYLRLVKSDDQ